MEASIASRGDFRYRQVPLDQPLPRHDEWSKSTSRAAETGGSAKPSVHGTSSGYARGCRDPRRCPNWRIGKITCTEARHEYVSSYRRRRLEGNGTPIEHGTSNGYLFGCRGDDCPGGASGLTCKQARVEYRRQRRQSNADSKPHARVSAARAAKVLGRLRGQGESIRAISDQVGVCRLTVTRILDEHAQGRAAQLLIHADTEQKIMSSRSSTRRRRAVT